MSPLDDEIERGRTEVHDLEVKLRAALERLHALEEDRVGVHVGDVVIARPHPSAPETEWLVTKVTAWGRRHAVLDGRKRTRKGWHLTSMYIGREWRLKPEPDPEVAARLRAEAH